MSNVTDIAVIRAKARQSEELGRRLLALVEPSRQEPGCINDHPCRFAEPNLQRFAMISAAAPWRI